MVTQVVIGNPGVRPLFMSNQGVLVSPGMGTYVAAKKSQVRVGIDITCFRVTMHNLDEGSYTKPLVPGS